MARHSSTYSCVPRYSTNGVPFATTWAPRSMFLKSLMMHPSLSHYSVPLHAARGCRPTPHRPISRKQPGSGRRTTPSNHSWRCWTCRSCKLFERGRSGCRGLRGRHLHLRIVGWAGVTMGMASRRGYGNAGRGCRSSISITPHQFGECTTASTTRQVLLVLPFIPFPNLTVL